MLKNTSAFIAIIDLWIEARDDPFWFEQGFQYQKDTRNRGHSLCLSAFVTRTFNDFLRSLGHDAMVLKRYCYLPDDVSTYTHGRFPWRVLQFSLFRVSFWYSPVPWEKRQSLSRDKREINWLLQRCADQAHAGTRGLEVTSAVRLFFLFLFAWSHLLPSLS